MAAPTDAQELRDSMTREVSSDAYTISAQIFKGQEPDVAKVSNDQIDARYRQAFLANDRTYLTQEAGRDPAQFLASMQRLGVTMPPGEELQAQPKLSSSAKSDVPVPKVPETAVQQAYPSPDAVPAPATPPPGLPMPSLAAAPPPVAPMAMPMPAPAPTPAPLSPPAAAPMPPPGTI